MVNDTITFTASDGSTQQVTVNITGTDDASVISGTFSGAVVEGDIGDTATATGSLSISDVDADDSPSFADVASTGGDNGFGSFELVTGGGLTHSINRLFKIWMRVMWSTTPSPSLPPMVLLNR